MHYGRHYLMVSVAYVTRRTYASTNDQWAHPACPLVSSSKTKPFQFSYVAVYMPANILVKKCHSNQHSIGSHSQCTICEKNHKTVTHSQSLPQLRDLGQDPLCVSTPAVHPFQCFSIYTQIGMLDHCECLE